MDKRPGTKDVLAELAARATAGRLEGDQGRKFALENLGFPQQVAAANDKSPSVAIAAGRQSGKSFQGDHADLALCTGAPGRKALIVMPNRAWAKRVHWSTLLTLNQEYRLGGVPRLDDLTLTFPNASSLRLAGADNDKERQKVRGEHFHRVRLDEAQAFGYLLDDFIRSDVRPALRNLRGQLVVMGSPSASLSHPFFTKVWQNEVFKRHQWNVLDFPVELFRRRFGQTPQEAIANSLRERGCDASDPTFRREELGEWVADENALVYRFSAAKNAYAALPSYTHAVFGIDLGWWDRTVISVLVWDEVIGRCYLAEEVILAQATFGELVEAIKLLSAIYRPIAATVDSSGNRQGFESIKAGLLAEGLMNLSVEPRKVMPIGDQVGLVNQALKAGRLFLPATSQAASDMGLVTWKNGIQGGRLDPGYHSDAIPALTYAYQYAQPILPEVGTRPEERSAAEKAAAHLVEARMEQIRREKREAMEYVIEDDEPDYAIG